MKPEDTLTRKQIAKLSGLCEMTIHRNEKRWNLQSALIGNPHSRPKKYSKPKILALLLAANVKNLLFKTEKV